MSRLLALDSTARAGSVALAVDGAVVDAATGDSSRTHGERLPGEVLDLLRRHGLAPADIDVYAVAAGPGSFTGLRVGIACVQGFALANGRRVVPVSALDALAYAAQAQERGHSAAALVGAWIDAQRGEVFSALYAAGSIDPLDPPAAARPARAIDAWRAHLDGRELLVIGDGALRYAHVIREALPGRARIAEPAAPMLAPAIAAIAAGRAARELSVAPHAIVPIYLRRPDAEMARDARRIQNPESRIQKEVE